MSPLPFALALVSSAVFALAPSLPKATPSPTPGASAEFNAPAFVRVPAGRSRKLLIGGDGVDVVTDRLRLVVHRNAVAAGHSPMDFEAFAAPTTRRLSTRVGNLRPVGSHLRTRLPVDGTKAALVAAGVAPAGLKLAPGESLVVVATFEAASGPTPRLKGARVAGLNSPQIRAEHPLVGFQEPLVGFENPIVGDEDPVISFENPIISTRDLFDFTRAVAADGRLLTLGKVTKSTRRATVVAQPAKLAKPSSATVPLGGVVSRTGPTELYVGPASLTGERMVGLVAHAGVLTDVTFAVRTRAPAK